MDDLIGTMDPHTISLTLRIRDAFDLFDSDHTDVISKKEVPSAIRYLNIFPKEREIVIDIIDAMQDDEPNEGFITFKNFHREILKILQGG
jgi:Ca2+-binding EF-hand superfamily protein